MDQLQKLNQIKQQRALNNQKHIDLDLYCGEHIKQKDFITSNARRMVAACSRRAGKSMGEAARLVKKALSIRNANVVYIAHTIATAENIMWRPICDVLKTVYGKKAVDKDNGIVYTNISKKLFELPNGSRIQLIGCNDIASIEKLRGQYYNHATIDECQSFQITILKSLIIDVLGPACIDYGGSIAMIGTPPPVHVGPFYDAFTDSGSFEGWERHSWTMRDNPFIEETSGMTFDEIYDEELKQRGLDEPDASFRREMLGEWVRGDNELVYAYKDDRNLFTDLPEGHTWSYTLGVDIGFRDDTAFVLLAFSKTCAELYLVDCHKQPEMTFSDITDAINHYVEHYKVGYVIVDSATGGTNLIEEVNRRYKTHAQAAQKHDKEGHISIFNDSLRQGIIKVRSDSTIISEWMALTWKFNMVTGKRKEDPAVPNHLCDAMLYGFRHCYQYMFKEKPPEMDRNSKEYEDYLLQETEKRLSAKKKRNARLGKAHKRFRNR